MKTLLIAFMHEHLGRADSTQSKKFVSRIRETLTALGTTTLVIISPRDLVAHAQHIADEHSLKALILDYDTSGIEKSEQVVSKLHVLFEFLENSYPKHELKFMEPNGSGILAKAFVQSVDSGVIAFADVIKKPASQALLVSPSVVETREPKHPFFDDIVMRLGLRGEDPAFRRALTMAQRLAPYRQPILIEGETGTGKELFARLIHRLSAQSPGPLVVLNCATLPEALAESILMGHVKGAFTGALKDQKGKLLQAHGGTLFLDEIAEMSLPVQAKLLRVIEDGFVDTLGSQYSQKIDIALVCATHRDLAEAVRRGEFRADLYFRLKVGCIHLPPLRKRRCDIPIISLYLLARANALSGRSHSLSQDAIDVLCDYPWPGNIRELNNTLQRSAMLCEGDVITAKDIQIDDYCEAAESPVGALPRVEEGFALNEYIRDIRAQIIQDALKKANGKQAEAARLLGISPQSLHQHVNRRPN